MGSAIKILPQYTYDDYIKWEGKWELIDGIPHAMSPALHPRHQRVATSLIVAFSNALKTCKECTVYQPIDYKISEDTILQPDILITCEEINKAFLDFPPTLVAEVLSPSTASKDRLYKFDVYQNNGIKYYLIVDAEKRAIEIYELSGGKYVLAGSGKDLQFHFKFPEGCEAVIDFREAWL